MAAPREVVKNHTTALRSHHTYRSTAGRRGLSGGITPAYHIHNNDQTRRYSQETVYARSTTNFTNYQVPRSSTHT